MRKLRVFLAFILLLSCCFTGCREDTVSTLPETSTETTGSDEASADSLTEVANAYIVQTPFYQIRETGLGQYSYKIATDNKVFAEGTKTGTEPQIEDIDGGIIRLFMGHGTNAFTVRYFDIWGDKTSTVFYPYTVYADYANKNTNTYLIAYFGFENRALIVSDIFDPRGFCTEINKGDESRIYNNVIILNENQIYVEYTVVADNGESQSVREVINFR